MAKQTPLNKLRIAAGDDNKKSYQWYTTQIRNLGVSNIQPINVMRSSIGELTTKIVWGDMYLFYYDPKTKDSLPYYDIFPLVLPFSLVEGGFIGLNLHYLPPMLRMRLFDRLFKLKNSKTLTEKTKIKTTWEMLGNFSRFPEVQPCVKRYLTSHVHSRFLRINPKDWRTTVMLPLETFKKSKITTVYKESRSKINA